MASDTTVYIISISLLFFWFSYLLMHIHKIEVNGKSGIFNWDDLMSIYT